jgi:hypothetical protein
MHISWQRTDQHWIAEIIKAGGVDYRTSLREKSVKEIRPSSLSQEFCQSSSSQEFDTAVPQE